MCLSIFLGCLIPIILITLSNWTLQAASIREALEGPNTADLIKGFSLILFLASLYTFVSIWIGFY